MAPEPGRTPERFYELYDEGIELHSILEASLPDDAMRGPFIGKAAAIDYFTAIAEAWDMLEARIDRIVAQGDTAVWIGQAAWRNRRTLGVVSGPKVDVWTVRNGLAVHFLELFDSYGTAKALGLI